MNKKRKKKKKPLFRQESLDYHFGKEQIGDGFFPIAPPRRRVFVLALLFLLGGMCLLKFF